MTTQPILSSMQFLHIPSMKTYEALGKLGDGIRDIAANFTTHVSSVLDKYPDDVIIVFPVLPMVGDAVVSYIEGDVVFGVIENILNGGIRTGYVIAVDSLGYSVSLERRQFHVVECEKMDAHRLEIGEKVVATQSTDVFIPIATVSRFNGMVETTQGYYPQIVDVNGRSLIAFYTGFRPFDKTIIDFSFEDEPEVAVYDEENEAEIDGLMDAVEASLQEEDAADAVGEVNGLTGFSIGNIEFILDSVLDPDGNVIPIEDVPHDIVAGFLKQINDVKNVEDSILSLFGSAKLFVEEDADRLSETTTDEDDRFLDDMFLQEAREYMNEENDENADHYITVESATVAELEDTSGFIAGLLDDLDEANSASIAKLSIAMNKIGRLVAKFEPNSDLSNMGEEVATILASVRDGLFEVQKARLDMIVENNVSREAVEKLNA